MTEKRVPKEELIVAACREGCPAGIDVPRYIRRIRDGKFDEALAVIRERIPFPSICGYACYSPCELKCGNRQFGDPIAIRALKRIAAEKGGDLWKRGLLIKPDTGKRVAVIGSGPSGLTAAYYLATQGHRVTVLEALDKPGGMMRSGIPEYRLPREALDREIADLGEIGVTIETGRNVESVDALLQKDYDAIYLACGAQKGAALRVPGEDSLGVMDGISFLRDVNGGTKVEVGHRVSVIGGGNTAFDAARSAVRLGAHEVTVLYRRSEAEMTAYREEVVAAVEEGVKIVFLAAPVGIERKEGALELTLTRMELGKPDSGGRPRPIPLEGSEFRTIVDSVITAVGQVVDVPESMGVPLTKRNLVDVNDVTLATAKSGLFAGGDAVSGPASIIDAITHGRKAAISIDRFLGGDGKIDQDLSPAEEEVFVSEYTLDGSRRVSFPFAPVNERIHGFQPVELGLDGESAMHEAGRCRDCDARQFEVIVHTEGCKECGYCVEVCGLDVFESMNKFNKRGYRPVTASHGEQCVGCMHCYYICPDFSIDIIEKQ